LPISSYGIRFRINNEVKVLFDEDLSICKSHGKFNTLVVLLENKSLFNYVEEAVFAAKGEMFGKKK